MIRGIVKNPAAPASVLLRLLSDEASSIWETLAWRLLPDQVVDGIVTSQHAALRAAFAESKYASGDLRARLVNDPDPTVRAAVAIGPRWFRSPVDSLPEWAQRALLRDQDAQVRARAEESLPPSRALAELALDADPQRRRAACRAWKYLDPERRRLLLMDAAYSVRGDAAKEASIHDADATDLYLLFTDDVPVQRAQVLMRAELHPVTARRLAETGDKHERAAIAGNPTVSLDTARLLADDLEPTVRLQFASRPDLTEAQRAEIDYHVSESDRIGAVPWVLDSTDVEMLRRCAASTNTLLRRSAACNKHLPQDVIDLLGRDDDFPVCILLCENQPTVDGEVVLTTFCRWASPLSGMLLDHPNFPRVGLARRFGDAPESSQRYLATHDPEAPAELLLRLSHDSDVRFRRAVASHPNLPYGRMVELLGDEDSQTSIRAAANPALPQPLMNQLLDAAGVPRLTC
ncbi:hypothetical protein [Kitasatospora viridis]|uniref:Leucine rich repeat (LRR) protein n=1 Tax=Kitasatospora viridis TaxID=281105 RepID=A0A561UNE6_9ACTN|nr:hypothetical protein [Kitasatospora viridis]TWG00889.1 hypothetical protein FHX73_114769 [Kitasatospora viridis]